MKIARVFLLTAALGCPSGAWAAAAAPNVDPSLPALSLQEVIDQALRQNPQSAIAAAQVDAALARVGQSRAPWLPQVNLSSAANGNYGYQTGLPEGSTRPAESSVFNYNAQVGVSQLVTDFLRTPSRIRGAQAASRAARGDQAQARNQVALNAISAFYGALQAEALYGVAAQSLQQQAQRVAQADSFLQIGTRPEIDLLTARTAYAQAELQAVQAQNTILQARVQLLVALGVTEEAEVQRLLTRPLAAQPAEAVTGEEESAAGLLDQVLTQRPDVTAQRERVNQAQANLRAFQGDYLPQLSLSGSAGLSGRLGGATVTQSGQNTSTEGQPLLNLSGTLQFSWPLLSGLNTVYQVREAEALLRQAKAQLDNLRLQALGALQQALIGVRNAKQSLQTAEVLLRQAELQLASATGRYQAGVGNSIELGDAQVSATSARAQRVQADYNLALARATLRFQLGTLVPRTPQAGSR